MYLYPPPSFGFTVLYLSSSSSKRFHLICNLLILFSLLSFFFLWLSYFFPRIQSKSPPICFSLFWNFSFALGRSSLMFEEELHVLCIDSCCFFFIKFLISSCTVCFNRFYMLRETGSLSICVGARAILLRFIYEQDKWDNRDLEKLLQSEPPKRKHQNKVREPVTDSHIWIHPFQFQFLLFLVVIITSFKHGRCKKWNPLRQLISNTTTSSYTICQWKSVL